MIDQYIERQLIRKNMGVYFKKGKWVLHLLFLLAFWSVFTLKLMDDNVTISNANTGLGSLITILPFLVFFYIYCLYLIPLCFKRNRLKKFWSLLILMVIAFPVLDVTIQHLIAPRFPEIKASLAKMTTAKVFLEAYKSFLGCFTGFTAMLFFMELLEGVRTSKETHDNTTQLLATERNLIKTRMDPQFINQSLDGIIRLSAQKTDDAPDSVIRFSDVLRYRLYRSAVRMVPLDEELQQLSNLIRFHNAIHEADAFCTLEVEGVTAVKSLPPMSLINIAEPLLNLYTPATNWSLLVYLLVEEKELQVAVELSSGSAQLSAVFNTLEKDLQSIFGTKASFAVETEGDANSIRICIPIQNS